MGCEKRVIWNEVNYVTQVLCDDSLISLSKWENEIELMNNFFYLLLFVHVNYTLLSCVKHICK